MPHAAPHAYFSLLTSHLPLTSYLLLLTSHLINVPFCRSFISCCSCAFVFITIGPYQATGSSIGFPETSRNRMPSSPACTVISSPLSKRTSDRLPISRSSSPPASSLRTARGSDASRNVPDPAKTYANACRELSTASRFRLPGGTDTSRYLGSAATPSTGPFLPQNSPHTTRTAVPSSSTASGTSRPDTS